MPHPSPELLQPQWFIPLFVLLWFGITGLLSYLGGWASLAKTFTAQYETNGEYFRFRSGALGRAHFPVQYGNCLFLTINQQGFRLSILFPFRFLSPPLFVPWSAVTSVEEKQLFFFKFYVVSIRDHWPLISIRGPAGRHLKQEFDATGAAKR